MISMHKFYKNRGLNHFHSLRVTFFLLFTSLITASGQEEVDTVSFYFDYRIEMTFKTPGIEDGQIIALYNSIDKYAAYTKIHPVKSDDNLFIVFDDGSHIILKQLGRQMSWHIYESNLEQTNNNFDFDSLSPHFADIADIAGYEAVPYTGQLQDGTSRRLWISDDSFDASALYSQIVTSPNLIPLTLLEGSGLDSNMFLLGSEIIVDNQITHSHRVTYLEYELNKLSYPIDRSNTGQGSNNKASYFMDAPGALYEMKRKSWEEWDRMHGLQYEPMTYTFDKKLVYEVHIDSNESSQLNVFYNSKYDYAGILLDNDDSGLYFILTFKNGTTIAYYTGLEDESETEAIFFQPAGHYLHLDHPEILRMRSINWKHQWQLAGHQKNEADVSVYESNDDALDNRLSIQKSDLDMRMVFVDFGRYIPGFPQYLRLDIPLSTGQIPLQYLNGKISIELIELDKYHSSEFCDKKISSFRKVIRH